MTLGWDVNRWKASTMADLEHQSWTLAVTPELTAQERIVLGHLEQQRTSLEIAGLMVLPVAAVRASVRTTLQKVAQTRTDARSVDASPAAGSTDATGHEGITPAG